MRKTTVKDARLIEFNSIKNKNGLLTALDDVNCLPFPLRCVSIISEEDIETNVKSYARKNINQVLVCINGEINIIIDDGDSTNAIPLSTQTKALYLPPGLWMELTHKKPGSVLMVFCDDSYDDNDFLCDYGDFLKWRKSTITLGGPIRLNIGCGGQPLPDYINVDIDSLDDLRKRYPEKDFSDDLIVERMDVFNLPFANNSVEEIRAESFIEHLTFAQEPRFFNEVNRVLKPGGKFIFSVPDFEAVVRIWLEAKDDWKGFFRSDDDAIRSHHWFGTNTYRMDNRWGYLTAIIYGNQNGAGQFHRNCYTEDKIRAISRYIGLNIVEIERFRWRGDRDPMLRVTVVKNNQANA